MPIFRGSLFEILVVAAILAICIGFLLVELDPLDKIGRANDTRVQQDVEALARALDRYLVVHGSYPVSNDIQQVLMDTGELSTRISPPKNYDCGAGSEQYKIIVGQTALVSCELKSKRFTKLGKTHWVWCSDSGRAAPTKGECPK